MKSMKPYLIGGGILQKTFKRKSNEQAMLKNKSRPLI